MCALLSVDDSSDIEKHKRYLKAFGEHLRKIRKEKGLTAYDLDSSSDVHYNLLGKIERQEVNPTLTTIFKLAIGLNLTPSQLLDFDFEE